MINRLVVLFFIALFVTSCFQYKKPEKPENLISKDKMVNFLIDLKLISSTEFTDLKKIEAQGVNLDDYVYRKHNIDSLQFALSNDYYAFYTKDYEEIYSRVIDSLDRLKAHYNSLKLKEQKESVRIKKEQDSLKATLLK